MTDSVDYLAVNRANWDSRAPIHWLGYGADRLLADPTALSGVVTFDVPRLGDIDGLDVVHTGIGALCWLPSIRRWAETVAALLRPGGRLLVRDGQEPVGSPRSMEWNHGLGETVTAVLDAGLQLTSLVEHDSVPWEAVPGQMTRDDLGEWRLAERPDRLPASFTLTASKPRDAPTSVRR